ncbi:hypothetical protein [Alteromonas sp. KUL150]|nr:hypothetical protein [Alteromonas sp. KUL150]
MAKALGYWLTQILLNLLSTPTQQDEQRKALKERATVQATGNEASTDVV